MITPLFKNDVLPLTATELVRILDNEIDSYDTLVLRNYLDNLKESDIKKLITSFLYESIIFQRLLSEIVMQSTNSFDTAFYKATIWHIADATHNMPACLSNSKEDDVEEPCVMYVEHYLCFLKAFESLSKKHSNLSGHISLDSYTKYITMINS